MPGLIDSTANFVEDARLVAQRLRLYADIVGRKRVIAGTDCGFVAVAGETNPVEPSIVWAKLAALTEGARIASDRL
jgi:5-methyltetrahydropteroyltriglutamate--homocysteine methyltransferase